MTSTLLVHDTVNEVRKAADIVAAYTAATVSSQAFRPDGSQGAQFAAMPAGFFGEGFAQAASMGESSTTSAPWVNKVTLNFGTVVQGAYYLVGWHYQVKSSASNKACDHRVDFQPFYGVLYTDSTYETEYHMHRGFAVVYATIAVSVTVTIDYGRPSPPATAYIKEARLWMGRVNGA